MSGRGGSWTKQVIVVISVDEPVTLRTDLKVAFVLVLVSSQLSFLLARSDSPTEYSPGTPADSAPSLLISSVDVLEFQHWLLPRPRTKMEVTVTPRALWRSLNS